MREGGVLSIIVHGVTAIPALQLSPAGILIRFPFPASRVMARVISFGGKPPELTVMADDGLVTGRSQASGAEGVSETLVVSGRAMVSAALTGQEATLIEICIERDRKAGDRKEASSVRSAAMARDTTDKLDQQLRAMVASGAVRPGGTMDVIIAIDAPASPPIQPGADKTAHAKRAAAIFEADARPVIERLNALGAEQVRPLWLGRSIAARLPIEAITRLAAEPAVKRVMLDSERKLIECKGDRDDRR